jgi:hypothetical protein
MSRTVMFVCAGSIYMRQHTVVSFWRQHVQVQQLMCSDTTGHVLRYTEGHSVGGVPCIHEQQLIFNEPGRTVYRQMESCTTQSSLLPHSEAEAVMEREISLGPVLVSVERRAPSLSHIVNTVAEVLFPAARREATAPLIKGLEDSVHGVQGKVHNFGDGKSGFAVNSWASQGGTNCATNTCFMPGRTEMLNSGREWVLCNTSTSLAPKPVGCSRTESTFTFACNSYVA